jgi:hypothetical protein
VTTTGDGDDDDWLRKKAHLAGNVQRPAAESSEPLELLRDNDSHEVRLGRGSRQIETRRLDDALSS